MRSVVTDKIDLGAPIPDLTKLSREARARGFRNIEQSLSSIVAYGFFQTNDMRHNYYPRARSKLLVPDGSPRNESTNTTKLAIGCKVHCSRMCHMHYRPKSEPSSAPQTGMARSTARGAQRPKKPWAAMRQRGTKARCPTCINGCVLSTSSGSKRGEF
jgi:hypothetical protein